MDDELRERYKRLFQLYGVGANIAVIHTKEILINWMTEHQNRLRPDAAYFLLVNFDKMIICPHASYVPISLDFQDGFQPNYYRGRYRDQQKHDILGRVEVALRIILEALPREEQNQEISAHQVMRVIDAQWARLQALFWG